MSEEKNVEAKYKYTLYATDKNGDGHVQEIGQFDELEEVLIRTGHFAEDVIITIEYGQVF